MPTTTNFGWTTPADTDLVKDGAAAIRTLGNGVDTSFVDLKGGTTGQVLSKNSNTDLDFVWVAQDDSNAIQNAIVDAKGDLISATAADTPARLAVGTNGQYLKADSSTSTGLVWADLPTSGKVLQVVQATYSTATTIASTTLTDSGLSASITPSSTSSKILIFTNQVAYTSANSRVAPGLRGIIMRGSTNIADLKAYGTRWVGQVSTGSITEGALSIPYTQMYLDSPSTTSSTTYKTQFALETTANSAQVQLQVDSALAVIILMEIGA